MAFRLLVSNISCLYLDYMINSRNPLIFTQLKQQYNTELSVQVHTQNFCIGRWKSDTKAIMQLMSHVENYATAFVYEFDIQRTLHCDIFYPDHTSRQPTELA